MATEDPKSQLGETEHGVDVADHLAFVEAAEDDHALVSFTFGATGSNDDAVNRTTATIDDYTHAGEDHGADRGHELHFGLPTGVEEGLGFTDPADRYEAIEGALAGLTACINGTIQFNALRDGIQVDGVETRVTIPTDLQVLFGLKDAEQSDEVFGEPSIDVEVHGTDLDDEDVAAIEGYYRRSPVWALVTHDHPNDPDVSVHAG